MFSDILFIFLIICDAVAGLICGFLFVNLVDEFMYDFFALNLFEILMLLGSFLGFRYLFKLFKEELYEYND